MKISAGFGCHVVINICTFVNFIIFRVVLSRSVKAKSALVRGWIEVIAPCHNLSGYSVDLQVVLQFPDVVAECCLMSVSCLKLSVCP